MKGKQIQEALFYHLRFRQNKLYLATEVWSSCYGGISDLLAYNKGKFYEYEVKVSMSDLRADKHKCRGYKHKYLNENSIAFTPDYFYFVVPDEIEEDAIKYVKKHYPKYGVISYQKHYQHYTDHVDSWRAFKSIKRASQLPPCEMDDNKRNNILDRIVRRMGTMIYYGIGCKDENI